MQQKESIDCNHRTTHIKPHFRVLLSEASGGILLNVIVPGLLHMPVPGRSLVGRRQVTGARGKLYWKEFSI